MRHFIIVTLLTFSTSLMASDATEEVNVELNRHIAEQLAAVEELQEDMDRDRERLIRDLERLIRRYERRDDAESVETIQTAIDKLQNVPSVAELVSTSLNNHYNDSSLVGDDESILLLDTRTIEERRAEHARMQEMSRWRVRVGYVSFMLENNNVDGNELNAAGNKFISPHTSDDAIGAYIKQSGGVIDPNELLAAIAPNTAENNTAEYVIFVNFQINDTEMGEVNRWSNTDKWYTIREATNIHEVYHQRLANE